MTVVNFNEQPCLIYRLFASEGLRQNLLEMISLGFNINFHSTAPLDQIDIGDVVTIHVTHSCWNNWQANFLLFWRVSASEDILNSALTNVLIHSEFVDAI